MSFLHSEFSRRFSSPHLYGTIQLKRAQSEALAAEIERSGVQITRLPGFTEIVPKQVCERKPHPEARPKKAEKQRAANFAGSRTLPDGVLPIGDAAAMCGLTKSDNKHLKKFRAIIEQGLLIADVTRNKGDKKLYYFWPDTIREFLNAGGAKLLMMKKPPKTSITKNDMQIALELLAGGVPVRKVAARVGYDYETMRRGIEIAQKFGMEACR